MKILVYPHDLAIGGSQLNAIEIGAGVRDLGHQVSIVGRPGALNSRIAELGLEFIELPQPRRRPSWGVAGALVSLIDERGIDLIHGYEWPPTLEAIWAARLRPRVAVTSTVMSMAVAPFIPFSTSLTVGTEQIRANELAAGRADVTLLEPPVDLVHNDPDQPLTGPTLRVEFGIAPAEVLLVAVTRLVPELKLEGLLSAIDACGILAGRPGQPDGERLPIRFLIVGGGPAAPLVAARAQAVNRAAGRPVVQLAGERDDPRPAYAAADIAIGMGGSALRALAYAKPLIVQGERGFFRLLTAETVPDFFWAGWYGHGPGAETGPETLAAILSQLVSNSARRSQLGRFGRSLVGDRFSLSGAAARQVQIYQRAHATRRTRAQSLPADVLGGGRYLRYYASKRWRRLRGTEARDDFNAAPVSGGPPLDRGSSEPVIAGRR